MDLIEKADWVIDKFASYDLRSLRLLMAKNLSRVGNEFNLEIIK